MSYLLMEYGGESMDIMGLQLLNWIFTQLLELYVMGDILLYSSWISGYHDLFWEIITIINVTNMN